MEYINENERYLFAVCVVVFRVCWQRTLVTVSPLSWSARPGRRAAAPAPTAALQGTAMLRWVRGMP